MPSLKILQAGTPQPKNPKWDKYTQIDKVSAMEIFRAKNKRTNPEFAFKGTGEILEQETGFSDNITDIRIMANERYWAVFGPGVISGYRYSSPPHEGKYRRVVMGKFLYRDNTIKLPRFYARVIPRDTKFDVYSKFLTRDTEVVAYSILELKEVIDERISKFPKSLKRFF